MWPNLQFPAHLVTFAGEIVNGKCHFLCSVCGDTDAENGTVDDEDTDNWTVKQKSNW